MLLTQIGKGPKVAFFAGALLILLLLVHISRSSSVHQLSTWRFPSTAEPPRAQLQNSAHGLDPSRFDAQEASHEAWVDYQLPADATFAASAGLRPPSAAYPPPPPQASHVTDSNSAVELLPCQKLSGGEDVLVVMRTGATEVRDKLPAHLKTTFKCYPNIVIFSDYEEVFEGYQVHDALKYIPDEIKQSNRDFHHYQRILSVGRHGLDDAELSGKVSDESGPVGKNDNAGWRLDKWKFLPMVNQTISMHPDKKWFVFVEPDTYLVWSNLLKWITKLDPDKASYYGSEVMIGDDIFAHGGSAFLMSKPAMLKGAEIYNAKASELHDFTAIHWAGDCVLGKTLNDAGVKLTWSFPMFQGGNPTYTLDWTDVKSDRKLWCTPAISYHHLVPYEIQDFWHFEQRWIDAHEKRRSGSGLPFASFWQNDMDSVLYHRNTFGEYIMPNMTSERGDWDNVLDHSEPDSQGMTLGQCKALCQNNSTCKAYSVSSEGCSIGNTLRLGQQRKGVSSAWLFDRVETWVGSVDQCQGDSRWPVT